MRLRSLVNNQIEIIDGFRTLNMENLLPPMKERTLSKDKETQFTPEEQEGLKWARTQTDFLEVVYSLQKSGAFILPDGRSPNLNQAVEKLSRIFKIHVSNPQGNLHAARSRKKDPTAYLSELQRLFRNEESME